MTNAEFTARANAICTATDTALSALPQPTSSTDYPALVADLTSTITLFHGYLAQLEPLVEQSADRDELKTAWLTPERQDFAAAEPLLTQLIAAFRAKDSARIKSVTAKLDALPDHTDQYIAVLDKHGLTACSKLESDSQSA